MITSWTPQNVTRPLQAAFKPAAIATANYARSIAPGPNTKAKTRVNFTSTVSALLDARRVGPSIYPVITGSRSGIRETRGFFVIPGGPVVKSIDHPGTPPHKYLQEAQARFPLFYGASARSRFGKVL